MRHFPYVLFAAVVLSAGTSSSAGANGMGLLDAPASISSRVDSLGESRTDRVDEMTIQSATSLRFRDRFDDDYLTTFVGDLSYRWPYRATSIYRPIPSWRYNRVDGLVLGIAQRPLEWDAYERIGIHGQVGYAFESKKVQYEVGAEARLGEPYGEEGADLKVGGSYRRLTTTDDLWKSSWAENTIGAFFFNYDLFDYYETQGWSAYLAARATPYVQLSVGFRSEDYSSLSNETGWSLFGGDHFRFNSPISEGRMQSLVVVLEGGKVVRFHSVPSGHVFRIEGEVGEGLGGDFSFNRITADGRLYMRTSQSSSLSLRGRVGVAGGDVPIQKAFSIGGIGSVRGYPQNGFRATRAVVGNAEYAISDFDLLDGWLGGLQVSGFFDAGWVSRGTDQSFDVSDIFTAAGVGLGFFERRLRLELAFPLTDRAGSRDPSLWLRLIPAF